MREGWNIRLLLSSMFILCTPSLLFAMAGAFLDNQLLINVAFIYVLALTIICFILGLMASIWARGRIYALTHPPKIGQLVEPSWIRLFGKTLYQWPDESFEFKAELMQEGDDLSYQSPYLDILPKRGPKGIPFGNKRDFVKGYYKVSDRLSVDAYCRSINISVASYYNYKNEMEQCGELVKILEEVAKEKTIQK